MACLVLTHFPTLPHKRYVFGGKNYLTPTVFSIFSTNLTETFLILGIIQRDAIIKVRRYLYKVSVILGARGRVAQWLRCCATNRKVAGSIPAGVSGFFIDMKSFRSHYGPGVDSASNRNEYQEYFLGVKAAGA